MNCSYKIQVEGTDGPMFIYNTKLARETINNLIKEEKEFTLRVTIHGPSK